MYNGNNVYPFCQHRIESHYTLFTIHYLIKIRKRGTTANWGSQIGGWPQFAVFVLCLCVRLFSDYILFGTMIFHSERSRFCRRAKYKSQTNPTYYESLLDFARRHKVAISILPVGKSPVVGITAICDQKPPSPNIIFLFLLANRKESYIFAHDKNITNLTLT